MINVVTVGWLTRDDIVLRDGACLFDVAGGGALYSAVGAQIWTSQVGIHSATGRPFLDSICREIARRGIDTRGIGAVEGNGLQLWLLHESETAKQQVPKLTSSTAEEMDRARDAMPSAYLSARAFHIAPQTPAGSIANANRLGRLPHNPVVTLDLLSDEFIDRRLYADLSFLNSITAFLPSEAEVARIWNPPNLHDWLREQALSHGCHLAVKLGAAGSIVCDAQTGALVKVPAFSAKVVDTTGAGDAYCGGFLAGLAAGRPVAECAAMGTVSASYVVEAYGALATDRPSPTGRDDRLRRVLSGLSAIR
jgi:sugar/nucleoside kinase (ribokinase family)